MMGLRLRGGDQLTVSKICLTALTQYLNVTDRQTDNPSAVHRFNSYKAKTVFSDVTYAERY